MAFLGAQAAPSGVFTGFGENRVGCRAAAQQISQKNIRAGLTHHHNNNKIILMIIIVGDTP